VIHPRKIRYCLPYNGTQLITFRPRDITLELCLLKELLDTGTASDCYFPDSSSWFPKCRHSTSCQLSIINTTGQSSTWPCNLNHEFFQSRLPWPKSTCRMLSLQHPRKLSRSPNPPNLGEPWSLAWTAKRGSR